MTDLLAARLQMAISLGFHIVFAEIGIAMPVLMVIAEWRWQRTGNPVYRQLARRWAKAALRTAREVPAFDDIIAATSAGSRRRKNSSASSLLKGAVQ